MIDVQNFIDRFIRYMKTEKRSSEHTLRSYQNDIAEFFECVEDAQIMNFDEINLPLVRRWVLEMSKKGLNPRSINRKIAALNSFFKYLRRKNQVSQNPVASVTKPKTAKTLPAFIPEEKLVPILDSEFCEDNYPSVRDRVILELFYGTGMRISELVNLQVRDIDCNLHQIRVFGKRNKERFIPMTEIVEKNLKSYISVKQQFFPDVENNFLFLSAKGNKINVKSVYLNVKKHLRSGGVTGKCNPHVLRHTFATHLLNNGADLNSLKDILGHANLAATQIYTHNTFEKLKKIHNKAHPRA